MSRTFGAEYADVYDRLYAHKQYERECDLITSVLPRRGASRILDMGCGTGGHALTLARRGHSVVGIDLSADMVRVAEKNAVTEGLAIDWCVGDVTDVSVGGSFDVVTSMFAVFGYLTDTQRFADALHNARKHLRPGGRLVFDVWYGPAVLQQGPEARTKVLPQDDGYLIRAVEPELHTDRNIVDVHTHLWRIVGDRVAFDFSEVHHVRYFFIPELEHLLKEASFVPDRFFAFPDPESLPGAGAWNLGCLATAV